jgi:hypothetical protein
VYSLGNARLRSATSHMYRPSDLQVYPAPHKAAQFIVSLNPRRTNGHRCNENEDGG